MYFSLPFFLVSKRNCYCYRRVSLMSVIGKKRYYHVMEKLGQKRCMVVKIYEIKIHIN
jgi:hypothetical protein